MVLGSIVKSITKPFKSVAKAAGKVLSSDIGKAGYCWFRSILLWGGGMNLGGAMEGFSNTGFGATGFMSNLGRAGTFI